MLYPHKLRCINNGYTNRKVKKWGPQEISCNRPFSLVGYVFPIQIIWRYLGGLNLCRVHEKTAYKNENVQIWYRDEYVVLKRLRTRMKMSKFDTVKSIFFQILTFPFLYAVFLMNTKKVQTSLVSPYDLYWENITDKRKRSILSRSWWCLSVLYCTQFMFHVM